MLAGSSESAFLDYFQHFSPLYTLPYLRNLIETPSHFSTKNFGIERFPHPAFCVEISLLLYVSLLKLRCFPNAEEAYHQMINEHAESSSGTQI